MGELVLEVQLVKLVLGGALQELVEGVKVVLSLLQVQKSSLTKSRILWVSSEHLPVAQSPLTFQGGSC